MDHPTTLFLMGALLIGFVLLRRSKRRGKLDSYRPVSPPPHPAHPPTGHHLDAPGTMGRWEVEMHELARNLAGQLDSKIVIVEQLVQDAMQAAAQLEAAIARAEQVGLWRHAAKLSGQEALLGQPPTGAETETIHPKPVRDWPNPHEPDVPTSSPAEEQARAAQATAELVHRTERVYKLADHGLSGAAIATQLGEPLGEVELLLSVRPGGSSPA